MGEMDRRKFVGGLAVGGASLATVSGPVVASRARKPATGFITREGQQFVRGGRPLRYAGANAWYLAWLGSDAKFGDRARLGRELDRLKSLGVSNVRLLAGGEEGPLKNSIKPGFVNKSEELNEQLLVGLDHAMAELGKRGMTAVLYFTNNWEWSGGMMTLLWYETGKYLDMNDPAHPWPAFPDAGSAFYSNEKAVARFHRYIRSVVTRTNTVTGKRYVDDTTLMAWQLCNEPRPGVTPALVEKNLPAYYKWIDDSAALIRSLDSNHLVSLGMEGTIASGGRTDIVVRAHANIDYLTAHIWPLNWGWVDGKDLAGTWQSGKAKVENYLTTHIELARAEGKPLVIEEFGFPRDGELYDPSVPTTFRQRYYRLIFAAAEASQRRGGPVAGTNFWAWNGEARSAHSDHRFRDGDLQYMGDPPHEPQGWYGNFNTDKAMLAVIRQHALRFATR